jgi:ABC-type glycerol-3-phosphate transport system permease component
MRKLSLPAQFISQALFTLAGLFVLLPVWGMARLAFDGALIGRPTEFRWLPKQFSVEAFLKVLDRPYQSVDFTLLLQNSMLVSISAALLAIVLGVSLAYAFARFRFPGRNAGLFILLLTAILPPVAFMAPLYILLSILKIRTTLMALIIVYAAFGMPFCIWNMRSAFQSIPKEVEEAAFLDGASDLKTFFFITLPLALPSIAVAGLVAFLTGYSEFALGWLFVEKADTVTLAMAIYAIVQSQYQGGAQPWSYLGSLALIIAAPVVAVFIVLQRALLDRMTFGSAGD